MVNPNEIHSLTSRFRHMISELSRHGRPVALLAVSKEQPAWKIKTLYESGQRLFGENRLTDLKNKMTELPKDIQWSYLGALQSSHWRGLRKFPIRLCTIENEGPLEWAEKQPPVEPVPCLVQVAVEMREGRSGTMLTQASSLLEKYARSKFFKLQGLMFMPLGERTLDERKEQFQMVHSFFQKMKKSLPDGTELNTLSQGMSDDYRVALECGATEVRIGTVLFGERKA